MNRSITTRKRILESAAQLYSSDGLGATSLRAIVKQANVNLNAVNYHFGSKDSVTEQLFRDIMSSINDERNQLLAETGDPPTVRELIRAIYWPVFCRTVQSEKTRRQIAIVNQIRQDPSPFSRSLVQSSLADFVPHFELLMSKATGVSKSKLRIPIRLMIATAWGFVSQSIVIDDLATKKSKRTQEKIFNEFLDYASAGFDALLV